ncbi:3-dehydroquinate synthase [Streptoalloteichus tenebrarius]|uniref:2-deoxy-scyllo-inosose synthase n=2 Tax=Actinomycetes TaxID=1760 RepID=C5HYQ7_9ACTN|nr:2-deoxy-scyllo-inosose synthase [Streptoalloteichus tenebrarius]ACR82896.1 AmgC [Streptomyces sp. KCTC 9047]MCP2258276.1 3-dehydroquinate synthase [Streptoalloteichus tenebrarius]BFF04493.1 2-deoxy-scyllo-inosose synthase [Streptoalloteichus tenebrarius]
MLKSDFHLGDRLVRTVRGPNLLDDAVGLLLDLDADRYVVVTDDTVRRIVGARLAEALHRQAPTLLLSQPPGEEHKTLSTLARHVDAALAFGVTRRSVVVAAGGGVPGNVAGLLAGLLFRGIRFAHVPTTVIAACDSVLSAKQAVNTTYAKNTVGLHHVPEMILIDLTVLAGSGRRDLRSGICETVKNALVLAPRQVPELRGLLRPASDYDEDELSRVFELSLEVKGRLLAEDPHERQVGVLLEYGHTVGHALELVGATQTRPDGPLRHGEAVALGMLAAASVARRLGLLDDDTVALHEELVARAGVCPCLSAGIDPGTVLHHVEFDNKRGYRHHDRDVVPMVLLEGLGRPANHEGRFLTSVPRAVVREAVHDLLRRGKECRGRCPAGA